jgi:tetratricopeptide (TPR) repeat protein
MLWLYASTEARFEQSVREILDQLRVRGRGDSKANIFQLLRGWLRDASKGPWLVILDNADDARVLLESPSNSDQDNMFDPSGLVAERRLDYIPRCNHGKVLVTSRSREVARELVYWKDVITVKPMEEEQALALLRKKLETWYTEQDALRLAQELDNIPLALTQAAAYICQRDGRCSIKQYLDKLDTYNIPGASVLDVGGEDLRRDREASNSIMLTWQISFNHIREVRPSAADLLSLMSFFDRQAIPEALLDKKGNVPVEDDVDRDKKPHAASSTSDDKHHDKHHNNVETPDSICGADVPVDTAEEFEKDLVVLRNYHFVALTTTATVFEMHRLVQLATKKWLKANCQLERWGSKFINNLDEAFPAGEFKNWETCRSLFSHAIAALHTEVTGREAALRKASLLCRSGRYARSTGAYADGEVMQEASLEIRRSVLGQGHLDVLSSMNNLAMTYSKRGRWEEADKLQVEVIKKRKEVLGEGHPDTLRSIKNLAVTYSQQGRWEEAEKLQVEVLEKSKEVLGEGHPSTLTSMNNLAVTSWRRGKWGEAEKLQVEVMESRKEVFGEGHPSTLTSMNNLAETYSRQGRWEEAEKLQVEVMKKCKEVFTEGHPSTLTSMNNLAKTYSRQGRTEEAEKLHVEVMEKSKEALGEWHPDTLRSMDNLTSTYSRRGRWEEAEKLQVEAIKKSRDILGEGHPSTLVSMNNLALTYSRQGRWEEAEKLQVEVMEKSKEVLGEGHSSTLTSTSNLASTLRAIGRRQSALDLMSTCVEKSSDALGVNHPDTRAFWGIKTQWEEKDVLLAGEEVVGTMGGKPADGEANATQALRSVFALSLVLAGIVIIVAVFLRQYVAW